MMIDSPTTSPPEEAKTEKVGTSSASAASSSLEDPTIDVDRDVNSHASSASSTSSNKSKNNKKGLWIGAIVVLAILVVFAIVFPTVYVTQQNKNSKNQEASSSTSSSEEADTNSTGGSDPNDNSSSTNSVLNVTTEQLRLFGPDIVTGYEQPQELQDDLGLVAWFLIQQVIQRNAGVPGYENVGYGRGGVTPDDTNLESSPVADGGSGGESANNNFGNGHGTNNQELTMEEGDTIVSDGAHVYAAYSDYLLIWDRHNGTMIARVKMPDVFANTTSKTTSPNSGGGTGTGDAFVAPDDPYMYQMRPEIRSLLLYQGRLMVIVQGYGMGLLQQFGMTESVLYDFLNTHVRIYDASSLLLNNNNNNYEPIFTANLQGSYQGARSNQGKVHLMTTSTVNTYTDLILPFEIWNSPETLGQMTASQYTQASVQKAQEEAIPNFVNKMMAQLEMGDSGFPHLVKLCMYQNEYSGTTGNVVEAMTFPSGILNSLSLVHSFDMMSPAPTTTSTRRDRQYGRSLASSTLNVTSAGAFLPSYWSQFYGSETHLIIAGQGNRVDASTGYTVESTNFLSFRIVNDNTASGGPTTVAEAAGSVDGYVINNYAMDVKDSYLRVGVSINRGWFFLSEPMPMMEGGDGLSDPTATTTTTPVESTTNSTTENYMVILSLPSRTNATHAGTMVEVGRLQLGKPNELFTAIRIYDNIAYAVTFERKDPLYVLDLSDPTNPRVVAELNVMGFSSYLHTLNANNTLMLGVGSSADENGTVTGTKLSVYDMSTPTAPNVSAEYIILNGATSYTYTAAEWDFKSLRVVPSTANDGSGLNLVALPIETSNWQNGYHFNGYWTFLVNRTHVIKQCENGYTFNESYVYAQPEPGTGTDPGTGAEGGSSNGSTGDGGGGADGSTGNDGTGTTVAMPCYYCGYMAPRAMLFDGNQLMTVTNHFVRSHNIDSCEQEWALDIVIQDNSTWYGCCGAYW